MSWDIYVQDIPDGIASVEEIPADFEPTPIGKRSDIIAKIKKIAPNATFSTFSLGLIEEPSFSIEISLGSEEECDSFAFHVTGGDDIAAYLIAEIIQSLGLRALDSSSTTGLFNLVSKTSEGLQRWREYKERIIDGEATGR